jgi:hypothetical protein
VGQAGFAQARQIFTDPTDFFRPFRFEGSREPRRRSLRVLAQRLGCNDVPLDRLP